MAQVRMEKINDSQFTVYISDSAGESQHRVAIDPEHCHRLTDGKIEAQELVRRSFEFLLKHEPKEAILEEFNLRIIERYFPGYERRMQEEIAGIKAGSPAAKE